MSRITEYIEKVQAFGDSLNEIKKSDYESQNRKKAVWLGLRKESIVPPNMKYSHNAIVGGDRAKEGGLLKKEPRGNSLMRCVPLIMPEKLSVNVQTVNDPIYKYFIGQSP